MELHTRVFIGQLLATSRLLEIREKLNRKVKYRVIAEEYGINICSIADIKFRRTWKHI